jgi:AcrR family transcriptional regulator
MGRRPNPERKPELLDAVVAYLCEKGIGELSLRPLAAQLEVSTYALVYHFGSKEALLAEALAEVERRHLEAVAAWSDGRYAVPEILRRYFDWCTRPERLPEMRLILEASAVSATRTGLPRPVRARLMTVWVDLLARGLREVGLAAAEARTRATLLNASMLGLLLDLIATGDKARVRRALRALLAEVPSRRPRRS